MDALIPVISLLVGLAILAPGLIRPFKNTKQPPHRCGTCSGCSRAGACSDPKEQLVQLKRRSLEEAGGGHGK